MALDTSITSLYEYRVHERRNDIEDLNNQICADWNYIHELEESKGKSQSIGYTIKQEIEKTVEELRKTRDEMWDEVEEFATGMITLSNWTGKGATEEELFNALFEPFEAALQPILEILPQLGLPDIPIIGNLTNIIKKISDAGRMIRKLPQQYVDAARAEAAAAKKADEQLAAMEKSDRQANMGWWDRRKDDFTHSKFGKIVMEIVDILYEVLHIIGLIAQNATLFAILELIKIAKPVIDQFQLAVGTIVTLIENVCTLVRMLILSSAQMLRYFAKMLEKKLTELYDVFYYVCSGGWSLPENALISGAYSDIVSCGIEISSLVYEINDLDITHNIELTDEQIEAYKNKVKDLEAEAKLTSTMPAVRVANLFQAAYINNVTVPVLLSNRTDLVNKSVENDRDAETLKELAPKIFETELEKLTKQDAYLSTMQEEMANRIDAPNAYMREKERERMEEDDEAEIAAAAEEAMEEDTSYIPSEETPEWYT